MIENLLSSVKFPSDVLYITCCAIVLQSRARGGFISVSGWDYFDAVIGSYRERRKGNSPNAVRFWEYPEDLKPGESAIIRETIYIHHSTCGWKTGVDSADCSFEEFKKIVDEYIKIAYPVYHLTMKIEALSHEQDLLTGTYTRAKFFMDIKGLIETAKKLSLPLWIFYMDLNNFKFINDNFGHAMGDRVLRSIAYEIKNILAGYGNLYRIGGDEFVGLVIGLTEKQAQELARRIEMVTEQAPCGVYVNASVGICQYDLNQTSDIQVIEKILSEADSLMYHRKKIMKSGVNQPVCISCNRR